MPTRERVAEWVCWLGGGLLVGAIFMGGVNAYLTQSHARTGDRLRSLYGPNRPTPDRPEPAPQTNRTLPGIDTLDLVTSRTNGASSRDTSVTMTSEAFEEGAVKRIETTALNFELVGTVNGTSMYRYAVVRNLESRTVRHLRPGDAWDDLVLQGVQSEGIMIRNRQSGRREYLPLKRSGESALKDDSKSAGEASDNARKVSRYQINQAIRNNMNNLLAAVDVQPVLMAGGIHGFQIKDLRGRPGRLLKRLGFKEGDVIQRVNGEKIDSMDQAFQLWSQLNNKKNFRVQIERNGTTKTLDYSMVR